MRRRAPALIAAATRLRVPSTRKRAFALSVSSDREPFQVFGKSVS